jgi:hypothetical protein
VISDVAVYEPRTRIVGLESYHNVTICGEEHDVSTGRVVSFGLVPDGPACVSDLLQDGEVVAVEMDLD